MPPASTMQPVWQSARPKASRPRLTWLTVKQPDRLNWKLTRTKASGRLTSMGCILPRQIRRLITGRCSELPQSKAFACSILSGVQAASSSLACCFSHDELACFLGLSTLLLIRGFIPVYMLWTPSYTGFTSQRLCNFCRNNFPL